jgi:hypothetical protein
VSDIRLSTTETKVFKAWSETDRDFGYLTFEATAQYSGIAKHRIRRAVRAIARKGLLQFGKGLWTDEGALYGSGYGLTDAGREYLNTITNPDSSLTPP